MMKMTTQSLILFCLLFSSLAEPIFSATPSVEQQCNTEFTKVGKCLNYATGKAASPSDDCCSAVKDIKDHAPVCLCFIIQQTHDGQSALKQMGLQESKLLQLPTACKLANASISECPKLLGLSPGSPDYAIFTNSSTAAPPITTPTAGTPSSKKIDSSNGVMLGPHLTSPTMIAVAITVFISVFLTGA